MECFTNVKGFIVPISHPQQALLVLSGERKRIELWESVGRVSSSQTQGRKTWSLAQRTESTDEMDPKPRGVFGDSTVGHVGYYLMYSLMRTNEPELPVSLPMLFLPVLHP